MFSHLNKARQKKCFEPSPGLGKGLTAKGSSSSQVLAVIKLFLSCAGMHAHMVTCQPNITGEFECECERVNKYSCVACMQPY